MISINGKKISCSAGTSVLEAAESAGVYIPRLCYHPALKPHGACRMCIVEDESSGRLLASCVTPVTHGMSVLTNTAGVLRHRRNIVRLMISEHPESCVVCSKGNRCQLRRVAAELGVGEPDLYPMPNHSALDQSNPFIIRDLSKCILCGRCIRGCKELVAQGTIDYSMRGAGSRPATLHDHPLKESTCTFCGTCVSLCPTGALSQKRGVFSGTPERVHDSICGFCGVGCSLSMGIFGSTVVDVSPSRAEGSVNGVTLCVRGHFAHDYLNSKQRLLRPRVRKDGEQVSASWDEAASVVTQRLIEIKEKHGPSAIGFFGSSKCTNEENYVFQKMARGILGTNNIDNGGFLCGLNQVIDFHRKTRGRFRNLRLSDIEKAEIIVIAGSDHGETVPVMSYYVKRAARNGVPVIVIDSLDSDLARNATVWLRPGPDRANTAKVIHALSALIHRHNSINQGYIAKVTENFDRFEREVRGLDIETLCDTSGIDAGTLTEAAELMSGRRGVFLAGCDVLEANDGGMGLNTMINLFLISGNVGHPGTGIYLSARENNMLGAWDMGTVSDQLPGHMDMSDLSARNLLSKAWGTDLPPDPGLSMVGMIEAAEKGDLKALYIMGENPLRAMPQQERVQAALEKLELLVVQDILETETVEIADVVLPGAAQAEKAGSFTNMEGRVQTFTPAVAPPGDAKADLDILGLLAKGLGASGYDKALEKIRAEIRRVVPLYESLGDQEHRSWIKGINHTGSEGEGAKVSFIPIALAEATEDPVYPFMMTAGFKQFHAGSGTRTSHSERIRASGIAGDMEISEADAIMLGLHEGDRVRIVSEHGVIERHVAINTEMGQGAVFVPKGFSGNDVMNLFSLSHAGKEGIQGWLTCRVNIEQ
ncbi:molybdopterin-dependent oxidoreductase [Desulfoluna spongiiphila]|uniref:molybdopterin-dependent oxidoreductase n=1 Tax=Desulfoluna spongiiphila TaxID=419481 RepID=UPI001D006085